MFTLACKIVGLREMYFSVTAMDLCPANSFKTCMDTPLFARFVMNERRPLWLLAPWQPTDTALRATNATITLFTYGYVLQDWLRELWRSSGQPRWAHWLVFVTFIATLLCAAAMGYQIYHLDRT